MKLCFVKPQATPLFDPSADGVFGGAEVRAVTFAKAMAASGSHDVHFIVRSPGAREPLQVEGVTVHFCAPHKRERSPDVLGRLNTLWKAPAMTAERFGRSVLKRLFWTWHMRSTVNDSYRRLQADVYCCFGVNNDSAQVVRSAKSVASKSVLFLASDNDLDHHTRPRSKSVGPFGEIGHLCHYALSHANHIIAQTPSQAEKLTKRYGRESAIIRNPIDLEARPRASSLVQQQDFALWIGRECSFAKRPDRCIELARECPDVPFLMIVNKRSQETFDALVRSAPDNVRIIESVPFYQIENYFRRAAVLVNTSTLEGFPNAFLQAGKFGVPILSWKVDPAGMLGTHGCGLNAGDDPLQMSELLKQLMSSPKKREAFGRAARRYVEEFHSLEDRAAQLDEVLQGMVASGKVKRKTLEYAA